MIPEAEEMDHVTVVILPTAPTATHQIQIWNWHGHVPDSPHAKRMETKHIYFTRMLMSFLPILLCNDFSIMQLNSIESF